jgi:dienelactone hydrolase
MDRGELARRFEIGAHPLRFRGLGPAAGGARPIAFATAAGEGVGGLLLEPGGESPAPAILYIHAHGGRYDIGAREALDGREALAGPIGPELAGAGFRVLAIVLPCFGGREGVGEMPAAKAAIWRGGSRAGQMLGELSSALDWLAADPGTDPRLIGVFGLSIGATLGYWLSAVEPRVAAVAHLCCFADFAPLIAAGAHDLHGWYLTVPGLVAAVSNGEIAGMIAPRPQFVGLGEADPLTPPAAVRPALASLRAAYAGAEAALRVRVEPGVGHRETAEMRLAVMEFLCDALGVARVRRRASG